MAIKLRDIKRAYQEAADGRAPSSRERCPSPEDLYASCEPRASRRQIDRITAHLAECRRCLEEYRSLRLVSIRKRRTLEAICRLFADGGSLTRSEEERPHGGRAWSAAAPLLAASLAALLLIVSKPASVRDAWDRRERSAAGAEVILLHPPGGMECPRSRLVFKWAPFRGADCYLLELFDESLSSVWQSPCLFEPSIIPPPDVVRGLRPGGGYFWTVTARTSDGRRAESAAAFFRPK
jgi:hypothetical protein